MKQDMTCPTCKGPVIKHEALSPTLKPAYRSTAAEQLEELRAANRELIRQHEEDKRRADVRAKAIRQTKQQLAELKQKVKSRDHELLVQSNENRKLWDKKHALFNQCIQLQQQLADKERELADRTTLLSLEIERTTTLNQQLTAQSAVVEAARAWHQAHYGPVGKAKPSEVLLLRDTTNILLANAVQEHMTPKERQSQLDKLQGGE